MSLGQLGSIHDIELGIRWDAASFTCEVNRRAALLSKMDVGRGSLVAILHSGSAHFFADLFAAWKVGATAACLDSTLTDSELRVITSFARPAVLLVDQATPSLDLSIPMLDLNLAPPTASTVASNFHADDAALVLFTSGTTGHPKGVILTFRALLARISSNASVIGKTMLSRTLVTLPTHFGHGLIGNALTPLMNGGEIVLHGAGMSLASNLGQILEDHNIRFMSSVPALWRMAIRHSEPPKGTSLGRIHVGSAPLSTRLWSEIAAWSRAEVVNCYGLTETANWIAGASSDIEGIAEGLVGRSWGSSVAVMDDHGNVQSNGCGEIVVQSPALMSGYLNQPDLTAAVVKDGWFVTGDRGFVDDNGRIWLTGRIKDEINRAGLKVQPTEIDLLLERHPAVAEACTVSIADPISGEIIAAAVRLVPGVSATPECLRSWCRERLRPAAVPERWLVVDEIPRSIRGKVNRDAVRRMFAASDQPISASAGECSSKSTNIELPRGNEQATRRAVQDAVERAWTELLGRAAFAANLSWSDAGGDSLSALRLWFQIETIFGRQLCMDCMVPNATPSEIVAAIEKMLGASEIESVSSPLADTSTPLIFWMSPAEGDLPEIANLRTMFGNRVRFVVIRYPSWREMIDAQGRFDAIVGAAEAQIRAQCQEKVCFLTGYSFGGFVAWETAGRLMRSGWKIGFLGLIDTRRRSSLAIDDRKRTRSRSRQRLITKIRRLIVKIRWLSPTTVLPQLLAYLVGVKAFWLLGPMGEMISRLNSKTAFFFQWHLNSLLRLKSLRNWELSSYPIAVTLFRSDDFNSELPDYGWAAVCSQVTVIPLNGSHSSLLAQADAFCPRFLEALEVNQTCTQTDSIT